MEDLGQDKVKRDGQAIIDNVLWQPGVLGDITIFTAAISAGDDVPLTTYFPPALYQASELIQ